MTRQRLSPEEVRRIVAYAQDLEPCETYGAQPGEPCDRPGPGRSMHKSRFAAAAIKVRRQDKASRRTPEQQEILAALPRVSAEEIEAAKSPRGAWTRATLVAGASRGHRPPGGARPCCAVRTVAMIADTGLLARADRQRLAARVDELADLDRLMRERGTLAEPDEPPPLHRAGRDTTERTTTS